MSRCIGIIGTRKRDSHDDYLSCLAKFEEYFQDGDVLVSGGCPKGGDRFAEVISAERNIPITIHYPEWKKYGRQAGLIRNGDIAKDADILIAVVAPDRQGGTEDTVRKYFNMGKTMLVLVE